MSASIHRMANGHYGVGVSYRPNQMGRVKREHSLDKLRLALAECDKMLHRQTRKHKPCMQSVLKWTNKRARIAHEIKRLEKF